MAVSFSASTSASASALDVGRREVFGEKTEDRQFLARSVGDRMWPMPKKIREN